jgi:phage baseplate assembly protein W
MPLINGYEGERLTSPTLMSRITGKDIYDTEHLMQSIVDILTTPKGSRVMRREYGSNLYKLLDKNITHSLITDLYAETLVALSIWEPRIKVSQVSLDATKWTEGKLILDLFGYHYLDGKPVRLQGVFLDFYKAMQAAS